MGYNVIMTSRAEDHLRKTVRYLTVDLGNDIESLHNARLKPGQAFA